jgi:hypothetical protein
MLLSVDDDTWLARSREVAPALKRGTGLNQQPRRPS